MLPEEIRADAFTTFVMATERPLRLALSAAFGPDNGREAATDALAYGWEHWDRVKDMENPAGYLYRVGLNLARRMSSRGTVLLAAVPLDAETWVEPRLVTVLTRLPLKQRVAVALVHGYGWSLGETASLLGVSKGTVQGNVDRGLKRLRRDLGVER